MPYVSEKIKLKPSQDRRRKLTDEQKKEIHHKYNVVGGYSQRGLASEYGVSRRLITFIIDPSKKVKDLENRKARGGSKIYYDTEASTISKREHRRYKQGLYLKGELKND